MFTKKAIGIIALLCALSTFSFAQEFTNSAIKLNIGVGIQTSEEFQEIGTVYSVGYIRKSNSGKFRYNPNIKIGGYRPISATIPERHYRSTNLEFNTYYDFIKVKYFSLFVGAGALLNFTRGHIYTEEMGSVRNLTPNDEIPSGYYEKWTNNFSKLQGGAIFSLGLRVDNPAKRVAYEIIPISYSMGRHGFSQLQFTCGLDVKF